MRTLLGTLAVALSLSGCSLFDSGPDPADTAEALAGALSAQELTDLTFTGVEDPQKWWDDLTDGLGESTVEVTAGTVDETDDDTATVPLHYRWQLSTGTTWEYDARASLTKGEESWSVAAEPSLVADLQEGERLSLRRSWAPRAEILGNRGQPIVTARDVFRIGLDKANVPNAAQAESARRIAALVDIDPAALVAAAQAAGERAFVEAIVLRVEDVTPAIGNGLKAIPGGLGIDDTLPLAPTREFGRPILGTVGAVTAEIVKDSEGVYRAGDEAGLSGLQARYDEQLRGQVGSTVSAVPVEGESRVLHSVDPVPGSPLKLTLDVRLQQEAERLLADVGPASALVAIRPSDGHVLAAASGPGGGGLSTATVGQYAPGSTMKVVSSLALLRSGLTPQSPMNCPATTVVNGKGFKNYDDYPSSGLGRINLSRALANSCNTAFIGERGTVPQSQLAAAAGALGLGIDYDLGYPVYLGSVPAQASSETDHAASLIGQGRVLASPMAMADVAASVRAGRTVIPVLVPDAAVEPTPAVPLTEKEAAQLRTLMRGVVTSGSGVGLLDVPGPPVLAKTGTAEFGTSSPPQTHAWMIAVQGDLAVAVFVDVGESGSRTAGPILEAFLRVA